MDAELKKRISDRMSTTIETLKKEFSSIRTGRASLSLLDGIQIDYYSVPTPLNQVATLGIPESRLITIQPWDPKAIGEIEKAILKSDLGLTPVNDGKIIRLGIPTLTEERRKQLVKMAKKTAEEARVTIRNIRRDGNEDVKRMEKEKHLSEDDTRKTQEEIQKLTDNNIKKIDEIFSHKEAEIMEI
ncbi:MAG: ribosome recycling factor [Nitrospirae bacterium]|nr:ribosome recycling factor [Nitrospirota bacterium]